MEFKIVGLITDIGLIAAGHGIREMVRLNRIYGKVRWRKMKGYAKVELSDGSSRLAEIHWYEGHGKGKKEKKIKKYWDRQ